MGGVSGALASAGEAIIEPAVEAAAAPATPEMFGAAQAAGVEAGTAAFEPAATAQPAAEAPKESEPGFLERAGAAAQNAAGRIYDDYAGDLGKLFPKDAEGNIDGWKTAENVAYMGGKMALAKAFGGAMGQRPQADADDELAKLEALRRQAEGA